jgi:hypothetical protein
MNITDRRYTIYRKAFHFHLINNATHLRDSGDGVFLEKVQKDRLTQHFVIHKFL